jgi:hypothetical protein
MKSRPRTISATFFAAPRNGTAFNPVSSPPRMTPLRRIVAATVRSATAAPSHGTLRAARPVSHVPPHPTMFWVVDMRLSFAIAVPGRYC